MIEQNIIEWLELGDTIQKLDLYNKKNLSFYIMNYLISQYSRLPEIFYLFIILLFFFQIIELNISKIDITEDGTLSIIKYLENIFLFQKFIKNNNTMYIILSITMIILFILSILFAVISIILYTKKNKKKYGLLITSSSIINMLNVYFLNGPAIQILLSAFFCHNDNDNKTYLCPIKGFSKIFTLIFNIIYIIFIIITVYISTLYINDIGCINGSNVRCKINNNYTQVIITAKMIFFIFNFFIEEFVKDNNKYLLLIYNIFIMVSNILISIYSYRELFYFNQYINSFHHYGWYFSTWFSICIFMKNLINIKDTSLFILFGLIVIYIAVFFDNQYKYFMLITQHNFFEVNDLKNIELYNQILFKLLKNNDQRSKILISGTIKRFEEYINDKIELKEQYNKLLNYHHLQNKFNNKKELAILSIIFIIYSYNIEKSKDVTDITLNMCYFLINKFKNPVYAIWLCTKLKTYTNTQSYFKYALVEEIKDLLIIKLNKNSKNIKIKKVQISCAILYNKYVDLFKIKIYEATLTLIDYLDILRNKVATSKTIVNYLRVGQDVLSLRNEVFVLWDKIIFLNPFCIENENNYILFLGSVLQDDVLVKSEEKKFNALQAEKSSEKNNDYFTMFNQEISTVLLAEGNTLNGKIVYTSPNFPYLFMFNEKEIINASIDDFIPDNIQIFHKLIVEDTVKYCNLSYIFKDQKDTLLKGKNGIIFNINLFVKPVPNFYYGLIYFIFLKKIQENNFILVLDDNLIISGFTEIIQIGANFAYNNFGLSHNINGHHIGLVIPEILLYLDYDIKNNNFTLEKTSFDLKGYLYLINNYKEIDDKIQEVLEKIKDIKINGDNNEKEKKMEPFEEYKELIRLFNKQKPKIYSVYFRIESRSFIDNKYKYYRIYITNDLLNENEDILNLESNSKIINNEMQKQTSKDFLKETVLAKIKIKEVNGGNKTGSKNQKLDNDNNINSNKEINDNNYKNKVIKLKKNETNNKEDEENNNNNNSKKKNSVEDKQNIDIINQSSNNSLNQSNAEPVVFNKIKNYILKKTDCSHVKEMRYLSYIFVPINVFLIIFDYFYAKDTIDKMIVFLRENYFFNHVKVCTACAYISSCNLILSKEGYIDIKTCPNANCPTFYVEILNKSLIEISNIKSDIDFYYSEYQKIFNKKINISLFYNNNSDDKDNLTLDINNILNLMVIEGMKIISKLEDYNEGIQEESIRIYDIYSRNLMNNSLKYFYSDYIKLIGKEKEKKSYNVAFHLPVCFGIYMIFLVYTVYIYYSYIILIKDIHIFYFDKLMNFPSAGFEAYLKLLQDVKNKFKNETNEEDDKNLEEVELTDDMNDKNKKESIIDDKNLKAKKQKILQQRVKNKKIISDYLCKINFFLLIKFGIIFLLSTTYYITSLLVTIRMKNYYLSFDSTIEQINNVYLEHFTIFMQIKEQLDEIYRRGDASELVIPNNNEIETPKFGYSIINLIKNHKCSEEKFEIFQKLYNDDACEILTENTEEYEICKNTFSSILNKGIEQAIIQINSIISNVINELNSLKQNNNLYAIYKEDTIFSDYEVFVEYYMFIAFLKSQEIFKIFEKEEKKYINNINKLVLVIFLIVYIILFIIILTYIYNYKYFTSHFLSFIGIIPPKYLADDNEFYQQVIGLEPFYY